MPITPTAANQLLELETVFRERTLESVWKKRVRDGLRRQSVKDLHDYLDVHRSIGPFSRRLTRSIAAGTYKPLEPFEVRIEKTLGITRRQLIPSPQDSLVLQVVVEAIKEQVLETQPTDNAFYARAHSIIRDADVDGTFDYPWWRLWPQYQRRVLKFARHYKFVVNTDIANYFDSIPLKSLREELSSKRKFSADLLDFLFFVLSAFLWRHKYSPVPNVGLPQLNFDAPRLLGHAYLFEIDDFLARRVNGDFVRWMDDINFGVGSPSEAKAVLGALQLALNARGLHINTSKTKILDSNAARTYFLTQFNQKLTVLINSRKSGAPTGVGRRRKELEELFSRFYRIDQDGNWEKVLKRFIAEFAVYHSKTPERYFEEWLANRPSLRDSIFRYLIAVGYSPKRYRLIESYLLGGDCIDDVSVFSAAQVLVSWTIPMRSKYFRSAKSLPERLSDRQSLSSMRFLAGLWILTKYADRKGLSAYVSNHRARWMTSDFLARQVAAVIPMLTHKSAQQTQKLLNQTGFLSAHDVVANLGAIRELDRLDRQLWSYFTTDKDRDGYPLYKVVLLCAVLRPDSSYLERDALFSAVAPLLNDAALLGKLEEAKGYVAS